MFVEGGIDTVACATHASMWTTLEKPRENSKSGHMSVETYSKLLQRPGNKSSSADFRGLLELSGLSDDNGQAAAATASRAHGWPHHTGLSVVAPTITKQYAPVRLGSGALLQQSSMRTAANI